MLGEDENTYSELGDSLVVRALVGPGSFRVEELGRDVVDLLGDAEAKHRSLAELGLRERAVVDRVDDRTGVLERATLAGTVSASDPCFCAESRRARSASRFRQSRRLD